MVQVVHVIKVAHVIQVVQVVQADLKFVATVTTGGRVKIFLAVFSRKQHVYLKICVEI